MAVFVQGRHERRHGSVVRLRIVRGREAARRSEVTETRPAVGRLCGPVAPGTPAPLGAESVDTLGFALGSTAPFPLPGGGSFSTPVSEVVGGADVS